MTGQLCSDSVNIDNPDLRYGCSSDEDCLQNGREYCERNVDCYGIAWNKDDVDQPLKACSSFDLEANSKWDTEKKIGII